ncbi:MAG: AMP nucleosidase [Ponticaulis sp.]|nr:AMP nucleosidase [Ponticaulis sp.]|tara:strand:+ start:172606 stop:174045 length:1440 start_codon:yes stop_codon:yes gene_type:complete
MTIDEAINELKRSFDAATNNLKAAIRDFVDTGTPPDREMRKNGAFCYPELVVLYKPSSSVPPISRSFGKFSEAGTYTTTVTQPHYFEAYLREQLEPLLRDYDVELTVRTSRSEIPYPYVWDAQQSKGIEPSLAADLARWFPSPTLPEIGDEIADGEYLDEAGQKPLSMFDALRTDFSLQRLKHYTGTPFEHFQNYVLFTNYHRYIDEFTEWAVDRIKQPGPYESLSACGNVEVFADTPDALEQVRTAAWRRHQMPAYHLRRADGQGITMVNIGVGPSNAKTITDHLAVLRPQCWIMVGHCGGLRHSQRIGDYALAHAYLRDDHVLDDVLPPDIPVPPIAEVQVALHQAAAEVTGESGDDLKQRLRTGTVVTTDDRNWELRYTASARRFNLSRAIAIDMESATIAANGYRFRVPYGVLLCVSDKPLHGEIKLPGAANEFYNRAIGEHIQIGIRTLERIAEDGAESLHSRKLRSFDEPPFR